MENSPSDEFDSDVHVDGGDNMLAKVKEVFEKLLADPNGVIDEETSAAISDIQSKLEQEKPK